MKNPCFLLDLSKKTGSVTGKNMDIFMQKFVKSSLYLYKLMQDKKDEFLGKFLW